APMSDVKATALTGSVWDGGGSPYAVNSKKFGMWLFIISDSLTFSALLVTYTYLRLSNPNWPLPFHFSPAIIFSSIMTFCLLSSSLTMVMAVHKMAEGDRSSTVKWLLATMAGGGAFIALHMQEWLHLIHDGVTPFKNPWNEPLFGATFFSITGLHMTHVACGVIYLGIIALGVGRGKFKHEDVEVCGLYWHFVDLVWMFVFPLVYLMSVKG
ncbi:MAG: cytochrome c oxidase subunit 3, partial [Bryobacteraceae bacterium]